MAAIKQPADKSHFILPDLGEGVHEAELISWKVKPGERVDEHQTLAEMETDKALVEVPSPWAGVVKELKGKAGDIINVGSVLVTYESAGASAPADDDQPEPKRALHAQEARPKSSRTDEAADSEEREDAGTVVGNVGGELALPGRFATRRAESNGTTQTGKALATPAVRRIARQHGIDINRVPGTGRGGRVTASDVEAFAGAGGRAPSAAPPQQSQQQARAGRMMPAAEPQTAPVQIGRDGVSERIEFRGVRRKIAQALHRSVQTTVHFTVVEEVDVTQLDAKRREYASVLGQKLSMLPFIMVAVCRALRKHPALNAIVDDEQQEILRKGVINLGCAVDTDHGLMVPVIQNADQCSIVELSEAVADLAEASRNRTIERERLTGGTFTITNVGSYGGLFATPIINYPEVAILAAGRAREQVMVRNGAFFAGLMLPLSLSCDHRVVDGAEGARFLNTIKELLEHPDKLLS